MRDLKITEINSISGAGSASMDPQQKFLNAQILGHASACAGIVVGGVSAGLLATVTTSASVLISGGLVGFVGGTLYTASYLFEKFPTH